MFPLFKGFWRNDLRSGQHDGLYACLRDDLLDCGVAAKSGWDAVELVATDHNGSECEDVGETVRKVRQVILMQEQGDQLLQPVNTPLINDGCCVKTPASLD